MHLQAVIMLITGFICLAQRFFMIIICPMDLK